MTSKPILLYLSASLLFLYSCSNQNSTTSETSENQEMNQTDTQYQVYTIANKNGMELQVTNLGAKVMKLLVPDKDGNKIDVVLGYDSIDGYLSSSEVYFGAVIGRYGNRIANAKFDLDGTSYTLAANDGPNSLHGGPNGFHNVAWEVVEAKDNELVFKYTSPDGEEGFPGKLTVKMVYTVTDSNDFKITYEADTDKSTVVNLTHHSFFNLNGAGTEDVMNHQLSLNADRFTPVDSLLIPLGNLQDVSGTPFDFRTLTAIGERIGEDDTQLKRGKGYDHNWVLNKSNAGELTQAAVIISPKTGIKMEVWTTEPGIQFYSGNFLNGSETGKGDKKYDFRGAFCLETQHFPDSPNQPEFPSVRLDSGQLYEHTCIYKFGIDQ